MISSNARMIWRTLQRDKLYVIVNILGLSVGLACFSIVALFVKGEFSYDLHQENYNRLYRAVNEFSSTANAEPYASAITSDQLGPMLQRDYAVVEEFVRFRQIPNTGEQVVVGIDEELYYWDSEEILLADENVFDVFTHTIIYGDSQNALRDPSSITISASMAERYFGNDNPIGESITVAGEQYIVNLVYEDIPQNSHLRYHALLSLNQIDITDPASPNARFELGFPRVFTYLLLPENYDVEQFGEINSDFVGRYMTGNRFESFTTRFYVEPLSDLYSNSSASDSYTAANYFLILSMSTVAFLILLVACVNYVNLSTARSTKFGKKTKLQKLLGASRLRIFGQFLCESIAFSSLAFLVAISVVELVLVITPISQLFGKQSLSLLEDTDLLLMLACMSVLIGFLSGLYPSICLSSTPLSESRRSNSLLGDRSNILRQALVFVQFAVSIIVLASVVIMYLQVEYLNSRSLGFEKENKIAIRVIGAGNVARLDNFIENLKQYPNIFDASVTTTMPGNPVPYQPLGAENNAGEIERSGLRRIGVDQNFLSTLGIELLSGRNFSSDFPTDLSGAVLVNETAVQSLGWENPIGKKIQWNNRNEGTVVGVVKDFNFRGLHNAVEPLFLHHQSLGVSALSETGRNTLSRLLIVDYDGANSGEVLSNLSSEWVNFDSTTPFAFEFLDNAISRLYLSEQNQLKLVGILVSICMFLSCLGLFGLSAFTTERRTKEIGIRKTLGAQTWQIVLMLFRQIFLLIILASVIASFISYSVGMSWLDQFYYRITISPLVFIASAALTIAIAFITMASQSYTTAQKNPVDSLRYE